MSEANEIFDRFPSFIKEYIYSHGWAELRETQISAAKVILDTDDNLLLSSSTASGKTEAAFFPILSDLVDNPPKNKSVTVLYIAPLKALINDQFYRLEDLLSESGIPLTHWHGDVSESHKNKLIKSPDGILQITPESLEAMLIKRKSDLSRLFGELRYIVIDEIHSLINVDRGSQVICLINRLAKIIGYQPRRIGLSATLGDITLSADWLGAGSGRGTSAPVPPKAPLRWRLALEHFYIQSDGDAHGKNKKPLGDSEPNTPGVNSLVFNGKIDPGYEYLYECVYGMKALVFSNSREETEYVTATLRQIAKYRREENLFLIHHGSLSASIREDTELKLKEDDGRNFVACATVTMELGIDIGRLERVAHLNSPTTVSSFLQRLGRSGRRASPPEMVMIYREDEPEPNAPIDKLVPWDLLRGIGIIDLYSKERFIEPPRVKKMPLSLAFHQTLSILASSGERSARELAEIVLSLPPLMSLPKQTYKELLVAMVNGDYLEMTEEKTLIVGIKGEKITNSYKFYAVFKDSDDFTVRCEGEEIGEISRPVPVGDRFALAGGVWEVVDFNLEKRLIFVKSVDGKMTVSWPGEIGEIHTKVLESMRNVLLGEQEYTYLEANARHRLDVVRLLASRTGLDDNYVIFTGGQSYVMFPWLGTRSFNTLFRIMKRYCDELRISDISPYGTYTISFKAKEKKYGLGIYDNIKKIIDRDGINTRELVSEDECPMYEKYDDFIPAELLREAYSVDRLLVDEILERFKGGKYSV